MADHWKSIANLLGAPGVDEPETETQAEEAPQSQPAKAPHSPRSQASAAGFKPAATEKESAGKKGVAAGQKVAAAATHEAPQADPAAAPELSDSERDSQAAQRQIDLSQSIPDEALSFKSLHRKPPRSRSSQPFEPEPEPLTASPAARISSEPATPPTRSQSPAARSSDELAARPTPTPSPAARSFSEPSPPPPAQATREAPRMPNRTEPQAPVSAPTSEATPRRKSSWESLANMFNIKVDRSKPAETTQDAAAAAAEPAQERSSRPADADTDHEQPFAIFSEDRPTRSNPALDAMFGETPQPSKSSRDNWGKPRVIDDLSWDDDDKNKGSSPRSESPLGASAQDDSDDPRSSVSSPTGEDDEEAPRRGRRRRRGRRGRSDSSSSASAPAAESTPSWGGLDDDETDSATGHDLHDDPWDEPESFELVQPDERAEAGFASSDEPEELSADGEVLRRSSRRRRRGRGNSDGTSERDADDSSRGAPASRDPRRGRTAPSPRSSSDENAGPVSFRADRDESQHDDALDAVDSPRLAQPSRDAESDDADERGSRSRRRRRSSSGERSDAPRRATSERGPAAESSRGPVAERRPSRPFDDEGPIEDSFDDASLGPDGDEGEPSAADGQRRSIPTWADSIASLIQNNTENRKRGDNRGAPRGRPRGRR